VWAGGKWRHGNACAALQNMRRTVAYIEQRIKWQRNSISKWRNDVLANGGVAAAALQRHKAAKENNA